MGLRNDLIEARKLIDTPEKMDEVGSVRQACEYACGEDHEGRVRANAAFGAILAQHGDTNAIPATDGGNYVTVSFQSILDRIDAAINDAALDELRKPVDEVRE